MYFRFMRQLLDNASLSKGLFDREKNRGLWAFSNVVKRSISTLSKRDHIRRTTLHAQTLSG